MGKINGLVLLLMFLCNISYAQNEKCNSFEVFFDSDHDKGEFTNVRATPGGVIIFKINHKNYNSWGYSVNVINSKDSWLKINKITGTEECIISNFEGWIHVSVVGISTTHDIYLLDKPNGKKIIKVRGETLEHFKILHDPDGENLVEIKGEEVNYFKIIETDCNWLKVRTKKGSGWVLSEKLCGNPVTTCP
ncbi:hypothetical protein [Aquimarina algiphila]|uniref:hypothetical protein n=1 Tax=Aquimarina algiphila TaxID=2047982 RepID=UPI002492FAC2|nr:hypothetical protein [Aquimarina algiphila]